MFYMIYKAIRNGKLALEPKIDISDSQCNPMNY